VRDIKPLPQQLLLKNHYNYYYYNYYHYNYCNYYYYYNHNTNNNYYYYNSYHYYNYSIKMCGHVESKARRLMREYPFRLLGEQREIA
jgi:hypothetical protein